MYVDASKWFEIPYHIKVAFKLRGSECADFLNMCEGTMIKPMNFGQEYELVKKDGGIVFRFIGCKYEFTRGLLRGKVVDVAKLSFAPSVQLMQYYTYNDNLFEAMIVRLVKEAFGVTIRRLELQNSYSSYYGGFIAPQKTAVVQTQVASAGGIKKGVVPEPKKKSRLYNLSMAAKFVNGVKGVVGLFRS